MFRTSANVRKQKRIWKSPFILSHHIGTCSEHEPSPLCRNHLSSLVVGRVTQRKCVESPGAGTKRSIRIKTAVQPIQQAVGAGPGPRSAGACGAMPVSTEDETSALMRSSWGLVNPCQTSRVWVVGGVLILRHNMIPRIGSAHISPSYSFLPIRLYRTCLFAQVRALGFVKK